MKTTGQHMKKLASLSALAVIGAVAAPLGGAWAGTIDISGVPYNVTYGTSISKNNVIGDPSSGIAVPGGPSPWKAEGKWGRFGPYVESAVTATISDYYVDWYFIGAESGDINTFFSGTVSFTEHNENNNYNHTGGGVQFLGTTSGTGAGLPLDFTVFDTHYGLGASGVTNGDNNKPGKYTPSLIFSYAIQTPDGWALTLDSDTEWFVFAYNDPGSKDKDHDDYIGLARVYAKEIPPVPIPGALPLMGSVVGGSYLLRRLRRSRRKTTSAAMAA
jgi:hypothetical protein